VEFITQSPENCSPNATSAPQQNCGTNCILVNLIKKVISDNSRVQEANTRLTELQTERRNSIDNNTGCMLEKDFHLTLITIGIPPLRQDNSMQLNMIIEFQQLGNVQAPTQQHFRVYYQTFFVFLDELGNFTQNDTASWQYSWTTLEYFTQMNSSNATTAPQTTQSANATSLTQGQSYDENAYVLTITIPSQTVTRIYTQASVLSLQSINGTNLSPTSPASTTTPAIMMLMAAVIAVLLFMV
jgi:hypothetical protein